MRKLSDRMQHLGGEQMGRVLAAVAQAKARGMRVIPMHAGEPDFDTPANIVEAAVSALRSGQTHYTPAAGLPLLRQAIASHAGALRQMPIEPAQVIVAPGVKPLIYFAMLALCQSGNEVFCPDPGYPFYAALANFNGASVISLPLLSGDDFRLDLSALRSAVTPRTRLIVLNSPSNPTGQLLNDSELNAIADLASEHDLTVLSDEIYSRITYAGAFRSIAALPGMAERTIIIDGYSKTYAMTGWRLGYAIVPLELEATFSSLMLNMLSCNAAFVQPAAVEALQGPQAAVTQMVETFRRRRDLMVQRINCIPRLRCAAPDGAFYVFARYRDIDMCSLQLSEYLLEKANVATYPGSAFGEGGEGFLRFSFACSESDIMEGLDAIERALALI